MDPETEPHSKRHKPDSDMAEHKIDMLSINTIRTLAADVVQKANSGHPGAPMGMAPVAHVLWSKLMKYNPHNPKWWNRDRFVLSNGHACALQYILLHLSGFPLTLDDLKQFRQLHSKTPGHPESHITPGIEVTTGPLGQGVANGVGLAIAEAHLAAKYNKPGYELFNNYTYVFCGDGCLQEGVASEAASLAGHLGLGKLIMIYDDNRVTIDGHTDLSFTEDVPKRFEAYGWHTLTIKDGDHDLDGIEAAIKEAQKVTDKPTIISLKTTIGFSATKQGTEAVHGSPLGAEDVKKVKAKLGFNPEEFFVVPEDVRTYWQTQVKNHGVAAEEQWNKVWAEYQTKFPAEAKELSARIKGEYPADWKSKLPTWKDTDKADATRNTSEKVLNALAAQLPQLVGGSADLTGSNKTEIKGEKDFQKSTPGGRYLRFGVREHGMAAIGNGLHAYGGIIPFTATFFNFIEYCFPAVRLAALAGHHQLFIMTHDSIGLGEDGPTHQAIEAMPLCRATPNLHVFRPADGNETSGSYIAAMEHNHGPSVLILTRQNNPQLARSSAELTATRGGYSVFDTDEKQTPQLIIIATGSEVGLAVQAAQQLSSSLRVRVVSLPSSTLFDKQPLEYRKTVIIPHVLTISFEALIIYGWERYSHFHIGMTGFGASAPYEKLYQYFGFTPDQVVKQVQHYQHALEQTVGKDGKAPLLPILYANQWDIAKNPQPQSH